MNSVNAAISTYPTEVRALFTEFNEELQGTLQKQPLIMAAPKVFLLLLFCFIIISCVFVSFQL